MAEKSLLEPPLWLHFSMSHVYNFKHASTPQYAVLLVIALLHATSVQFQVHLKSRGKRKQKHMEELTIGEVARRAGMRTSALRYYESVGLLPAPRRVYGGH